jgi:hypothetical protein
MSDSARQEYQTIFRLLSASKPENSNSNNSNNSNNANRKASQTAFIDFQMLKRLSKEFDEKISDEQLLWMLSLARTPGRDAAR